MVKKLEDILVGHGVTITVSLPDNDSLYWDSKTKRFWCYDNMPVRDWLDSPNPPDPERLADYLPKLVTHAIEKQNEYDAKAQAAAVELAKYVSSVGWYKPELVNPIGPVLPAEE